MRLHIPSSLFFIPDACSENRGIIVLEREERDKKKKRNVIEERREQGHGLSS